VVLLPMVAWVAVNGVPLHRNLRYIMTLAIFHGWIGVIARGILLAGQIFGIDSKDCYSSTLGSCQFTHSHLYFEFNFRFFGVTTERFVATNWSLW
ncbi:hypothetical protein PMAYCL1PPCAC_17504, partial [Pristionchus mayeri]